MPRSIIRGCRLNIKRSLLDKLIDAYLDARPATRVGVADKYNVSKSTSGKVATALFECGFAEQRLYADKASRPALHVFLKPELHAMVIDLSCSIYSMNILDASGKCIFSYKHSYDASVSFDDNLNIFLSRGGYQAKTSQKSFHAVAVIVADHHNSTSLSLQNPTVFIPTMADKARIERIISSVFKPHSTSFATLSDCVGAAVRFGIIPASNEYFGVSYIFIGSHVCAFNVSHLGAMHCDIQSLMIGSSSLGEITRIRMDADSFTSVLTSAVNLMQCAYNASSVMIDSDIYDITDDTIRKIYRDCAKVGIIAPTLIASTDETRLTHMGAMKLAFSDFIRTFILASDDEPNN